ncbi:hypothetical protein Tco_1048132 [Tanacetum coccineum]
MWKHHRSHEWWFDGRWLYHVEVLLLRDSLWPANQITGKGNMCDNPEFYLGDSRSRVLLALLIMVTRDDFSVTTSVGVSVMSVLVLEVESLDSILVMAVCQLSFRKVVSNRALEEETISVTPP